MSKIIETISGVLCAMCWIIYGISMICVPLVSGLLNTWFFAVQPVGIIGVVFHCIHNKYCYLNLPIECRYRINSRGWQHAWFPERLVIKDYGLILRWEIIKGCFSKLDAEKTIELEIMIDLKRKQYGTN